MELLAGTTDTLGCILLLDTQVTSCGATVKVMQTACSWRC
ncbi:hypothetical protein SLEP1_g41701 [Rubroshorea leprosula]|uniref:Uncharacterized protein n=1 Tax=Rubroshorea leprosula TaxID=152421 RepID=A0AAV5L7D7_9ROSI|nr:hypothetical protein SLEP1_g41701 [Rubroshorea leprosula]